MVRRSTFFWQRTLVGSDRKPSTRENEGDEVSTCRLTKSLSCHNRAGFAVATLLLASWRCLWLCAQVLREVCRGCSSCFFLGGILPALSINWCIRGCDTCDTYSTNLISYIDRWKISYVWSVCFRVHHRERGKRKIERFRCLWTSRSCLPLGSVVYLVLRVVL